MTNSRFQVVGVQPDEMGVGPAVAIPAVLKATGLSVADIDVFEVNEAFASQALYSVRQLRHYVLDHVSRSSSSVMPRPSMHDSPIHA